MATLPKGWVYERGSGWWEIHHVVHEACGFRSWSCYDLCRDEDRRNMWQLIDAHECEDRS